MKTMCEGNNEWEKNYTLGHMWQRSGMELESTVKRYLTVDVRWTTMVVFAKIFPQGRALKELLW